MSSGDAGNGLESLFQLFERKYGKSPEFYCKAPGRVNLIGEHIDYCGYSVLPMAIELNITIIAATNTEGKISISSDRDSFESVSASVENTEIDRSNLKWYHYVFCGLRAVEEVFGLKKSKGISMLISGTIPMGSGLSSSSALVVWSALCFIQGNSLTSTADRKTLADGCARAERHIGTQGGGMDQSICLLGEKGEAKKINFNPLSTESVQLPQNTAFVISHSCTSKQKAQTNDFNRRVVECRLSALILQKYKTGEITIDKIPTLKQIQELYDASLEHMVNQLDFAFARKDGKGKPNDIFDRKEVCEFLGISEEVLSSKILSANTQDVQEFNLYDRAEHVFTEALRVIQFKRTCDEDKGPNALVKLGILMDGSHWSCSKKYECSSAELDELTDVARNAGALGSRLTGAGWGGCCVSLVHQEKVESFINQVKKEFYSGNPDWEMRLPEAIFASTPFAGASVFDENHSKLW